MSKKKLYHGTSENAANNIIKHGIDLHIGRTNLDFGKGFYLAQRKGTAIDWALRVSDRTRERAVVITYELNTDNLNIKLFSKDDIWIREVIRQRNGIEVISDIDVFIGPIADGDTINDIKLYCAEEMPLDTLIERLSAKDYGLQFVLKTDKAVENAKIIKKEVL